VRPRAACLLAALALPSAVAACGGVPPPLAGVACAPAGAGDVAAAEAAVGRVIDDWHDAAARADEARYFAHFARGGVFLGTDASERWDVAAFRAYAHPRFAQGKAWSFRSARRTVTIDPTGQVAWFDEALETARLGPCRGSGVVVRECDASRAAARDCPWKLAQYNLTITVPNDRFAEVRALLAAPAPPAPAGP
jgi:hypothetical protein